MAERMKLRREADADSAECAAAELLKEEEVAAPKESPKRQTLVVSTVYELATACPGRFSNTGHRVKSYCEPLLPTSVNVTSYESILENFETALKGIAFAMVRLRVGVRHPYLHETSVVLSVCTTKS